MSEIPLKDSFVHQGAALVHVQIFHYHCGIADCESPVSSASAAITAYLICMSNESERPPTTTTAATLTYSYQSISGTASELSDTHPQSLCLHALCLIIMWQCLMNELSMQRLKPQSLMWSSAAAETGGRFHRPSSCVERADEKRKTRDAVLEAPCTLTGFCKPICCCCFWRWSEDFFFFLFSQKKK